VSVASEIVTVMRVLIMNWRVAKAGEREKKKIAIILRFGKRQEVHTFGGIVDVDSRESQLKQGDEVGGTLWVSFPVNEEARKRSQGSNNRKSPVGLSEGVQARKGLLQKFREDQAGLDIW